MADPLLSGFSATWPAPPVIRTWITQRTADSPSSRYGEGNLALHVGEDPAVVLARRRALVSALGLSRPPQWLNQIHGSDLIEFPFAAAEQPLADGCWSCQSDTPCAVLTADCLPLLLTNRAGDRVAALHVGWRGLVAGVVERGVELFPDPQEALLSWIGPAIGQPSYEVGAEVRGRFCDQDPAAAELFRPSSEGGWLASMEGLVRLRLQRLGVASVHGGGWDTYRDKHFYSYRRQQVTGRFATLIWIDSGGVR